MTMTRTLVLGYGNPGRLDDGLGPAFADAIGEICLPDVNVTSDYQLSAEHAAELLPYDRVLFADASVDAEAPYCLRPLLPRAAVSFTSHSMRPEAVLALAIDSLGWAGHAYILGIRGYEFNEYDERLSKGARMNLQRTVDQLTPALDSRLDETVENIVTGEPIQDSVRIGAGNES